MACCFWSLAHPFFNSANSHSSLATSRDLVGDLSWDGDMALAMGVSEVWSANDTCRDAACDLPKMALWVLMEFFTYFRAFWIVTGHLSDADLAASLSVIPRKNTSTTICWTVSSFAPGCASWARKSTHWAKSSRFSSEDILHENISFHNTLGSVRISNQSFIWSRSFLKLPLKCSFLA